MKKLIDRLEQEQKLSKEEWVTLLSSRDEEAVQYAADRARKISEKYFSRKIYIRGLIEISNYCKNNCYYCGIRRDNKLVDRYRLTKDEILACCQEGYELGFRTFVLQGGEDAYYSDERMTDLIRSIKAEFQDCALTLSLGEKKREAYQKYYDAGADRYLLRHETADEEHYGMLHPKEMSLPNRMQCLWDLKEIGFQTGCGFLVGSPGQTWETLAEDMLFIHRLNPQMVGIGPFLPHSDTPFADKEPGKVSLTLFLLSLIRIMQRNVLLPATTALGTAAEGGREQGILAGANVIMPNLSPVCVREKYMLYNNKLSSGNEAAGNVLALKKEMKKLGYEIVSDRGDFVQLECESKDVQ